ncbi:hypothetical protein EPI10_021710 [Gossypium australe]|uniref:Uncharacterized protein n=1 Tax=Gossypium australe TaxID=47621 RepID=A0A5B6WJB9_9ROSI|nr:hypothetical protein EPI10_021710 [Gossypium australe]
MAYADALEKEIEFLSGMTRKNTKTFKSGEENIQICGTSLPRFLLEEVTINVAFSVVLHG